MSTIDVKDATGQTVALEKPLVPGRAAATLSRPVVLSNEDKIALDLIATALGTAPAGAATAANQATQITSLAAILAKLSADPATQTTLAAVLAKLNSSVAVTGTFWQATQPVSIAAAPVLVAGSAIIGKVGIDQTVGQNLVKQVRSTAGAQSSVAGSATSVTVLASNASRLGASIYNDSTVILYLLLGTGPASTTSYTAQMGAGNLYEVPAFYTGAITGIWASATGNARVTELT